MWFRSDPAGRTLRGTVFPANALVRQQGKLTRIWAARGRRPRAPRDNRYTWARAIDLEPRMDGSRGATALFGSGVWSVAAMYTASDTSGLCW